MHQNYLLSQYNRFSSEKNSFDASQRQCTYLIEFNVKLIGSTNKTIFYLLQKEYFIIVLSLEILSTRAKENNKIHSHAYT